MQKSVLLWDIFLHSSNLNSGVSMFQGTSAITLDAKGRMSIPARHRDALAVQCDGRMTLTRSPDGCLLLYPRPVWESQREKIAAWPMAARSWQRIFLGSAVDVDLDSSCRILVSPELREVAGLMREIKLVGMGSHFEVWDAAKLDEDAAEAIASGMPEALSDFSL